MMVGRVPLRVFLLKLLRLRNRVLRHRLKLGRRGQKGGGFFDSKRSRIGQRKQSQQERKRKRKRVRSMTLTLSLCLLVELLKENLTAL
jgi:hypothetical protein